MPQKYFLTTPIYYVNARPHIGHAYTTIVADVLARRHRLLGEDVFFLTGTDEHGQKIERSASAAGIPPQQFADQVSDSFRGLWKRMGITNDDFIRTTEPRHRRAVQKLFQALEANGAIYLDSYTGAYCVSDEAFVDVPVGSPCPDCGRSTEAVTEENYFFRLSQYQQPLLDLIESNALLIEPESRRNEVLSFLRGNITESISAIGREINGPDSDTVDVHEALAAGLSSGKLASSASNYMYVPGALRDLSISRSSFTWGIPVPTPSTGSTQAFVTTPNPEGHAFTRAENSPGEAGPALPKAALPPQDHVIYVWLDALTNYMTAVGYGSDDPADLAKFNKYWPADLHIVGKEIIRFHCIYWPAFLLAAKLKLPKKVVAHGWLLFEESKMSKSRGNIVRTETILDAFGPLCPAQPTLAANPNLLSFRSEAEESAVISSTKAQQDLFASDILRYFLLREIPFGQDGSFSFDAMITRYNADLANGYGNLVSRTLKMIQTSCGAEMPKPESTAILDLRDQSILAGELAYLLGARSYLADLGVRPQDKEGLQASIGIPLTPPIASQASFALDVRDFTQYLERVSTFISGVDGFITASAPWTLAKVTARNEQLSAILYTAAESIRIITALLYPILPFATANVWRQLGLGDIELAAQNGELNNLQWGGLKPGTKLGPLSPIFPRADKGLAQTMADIEASQAKPLSTVTTQADAATPTTTEFPVTSLASELVTNPPEHFPSTDPAAGFRTTSIPEPAPGTLVAGSSALTTEREAPPSGAPSFSESHPEKGGVSSEARPSSPADASNKITIDDFAKVELRVAKILVAERIPKADKLLRLEVDLGYERRQILSGIAEWYTPEDLLGRRIVVITNLAPRKMRGLESRGMLLAASAPEGGKPALATFADTDDLPLGSRLK